ncbi:precorrin-3B synthase [Mycolicibacterium thermoresistibile]|uniref:Precorrin-3B synthase n=2 Tax=Mycolicibacterium thermoresistibile TaxID=1797 RepID=G7CAP0_MYCT3|nr:precorrin-3B synthase [Mycolicibacterium thermoresistibile]EHI14920.1 precorrin-3B synthase [Mycolicibacterium thermoresistibile ATCC 19527]MCV7188527.1 precorrin-3B synthase [Mycolicibacterium thermoresistibile]GAT17385.1 cobalamin biosynthesis protein cobG [Mycolicibacterium thermoresistibile]SNW18141.1 precorrin-3B synthase [Mycolicibacterium thermoresistibile]
MERAREHDACPGALSVHPAADGALARIRLPGGMLTPAQLTALADAARRFGSEAMELTSRGNIQIRGISDPAAVADAVAAAGLLPSPTHETVRNIVASPLSGRCGGATDIRPWVTRLDHAIQSELALAALPGRFLFGIDDGRGDIAALAADVAVQTLGASGDEAAVLLAGRDSGVRVAAGDAVEVMVTVARRFTASRGGAWRIAELDDTSALLDGFARRAAPAPATPAPRPPIGWIPQDDGRVTLAAGVPLGVLTARLAEFLAAIDAPLIVTPWRSVLVCDLDEGVADTAVRVLAPLGLIFDENSPWLRISSCTGLPGCARSAADVRADAARAATEAAPPGQTRVHRHFVGCERACGTPPGAQVLVATGEGYRLRNPHP